MGIAFSKPRPLAVSDDIGGFHCGEQSIDEWLAKRAKTARSRGTAVVYVTYAGAQLAGYYTLSSDSISRLDVTGGWLARNTPERIPVILLGRLGVDERYAHQGLGRDLLLDAIHRAGAISNSIGAKALILTPLNEQVRDYYLHLGFLPVPGPTTYLYAKI